MVIWVDGGMGVWVGGWVNVGCLPVFSPCLLPSFHQVLVKHSLPSTARFWKYKTDQLLLLWCVRAAGLQHRVGTSMPDGEETTTQQRHNSL